MLQVKPSTTQSYTKKFSKFRSIFKILPGWLHISSKLKLFS